MRYASPLSPPGDPGGWTSGGHDTGPRSPGARAEQPPAVSDIERLGIHLVRALTAMRDGADERRGPLPAATPTEVEARVSAALERSPIPERGVGANAALDALGRLAGWGAADPADPRCAGHLHTPPLAVAVAADAVASTMNQSLDSWDQAPAMTHLEDEVISAIGALVYGPARRTSGAVTTGGTESNLMGLLLARSAAGSMWGFDPLGAGLAGQASRARVYCSEHAHFSVQRMAGLLGLGESAVVPVPVDGQGRMRPELLDRRLRDAAGTHPLAVVATAGTTDAGAVDPLEPLAEVARAHDCWLHVDAAYGGGALLSDRLRPLLTGLDLADSVALDLHKLGWQPAPAGIFVAPGEGSLAPLDRTVSYLNTVDDEAAGYTSLVGRSLRTTRRPDVLKIAVTFRALGRERLGAMVDRCHQLAVHAAAHVDADERLERAFPVTLSTLVFRYAAHDRADEVNAVVRRRLLAEGRAVVGRCDVDGQVWLKLTLLNHEASESDIGALVESVAATGSDVAAETA